VIAAGPPVAWAPLVLCLAILERRVARRKHFPALEPHDRRVGLLVLQLLQRRQQIFHVAATEGRRLPARDNRPIRRS
jgi:hypothetical protein